MQAFATQALQEKNASMPIAVRDDAILGQIAYLNRTFLEIGRFLLTKDYCNLAAKKMI